MTAPRINLRGIYTYPVPDVLESLKPRIFWILLALAVVLGGVGAKMWRDSVANSRARDADIRLANERAAAEVEIKKLQLCSTSKPGSRPSRKFSN